MRGAPCGWKWTARSDRRVLCTTSGLQACSTSLSKSDGDAPALLHSHMKSCSAMGPKGQAWSRRTLATAQDVKWETGACRMQACKSPSL